MAAPSPSPAGSLPVRGAELSRLLGDDRATGKDALQLAGAFDPDLIVLDVLLDNVWGWEYAGQSQVLETYVSYLRRKLDPLAPPTPRTSCGRR